MNVKQLEIKKYITSALLDLKFKELSQVQVEVIKNYKLNKNLLVKSKTGSGKTHAFLIPIFESLNEELKEVQTVIIAPTKELSMQIYKVAQHIASFSDKAIDIRVYSGGSDRIKEISRLKNSQPQIVIATPGKIKDLAIDENVLKVYTAKNLIIDEVDMVLDSGYQEEIDGISGILKDAKMMFFSATMNEQVLPFIKKYLDAPIFIEIVSDDKLNIEHFWIPLKHKDRFEMLLSLLKTFNPYLAIIFCNKTSSAIELAKNLSASGYKVAQIHKDVSPRERKRILQEVNNLKYQYIVATDLAARGIDIDGVSHVINYEIPQDFEFYIHRSGRTGRMNYTGVVYSFYSDLDDKYLDNLNSKGVKPSYKEIKNNELLDYVGRNRRIERVRPLTEAEKKAKSLVKKPTKVKPGYKKKMREKEEQIKNQILKNAGKRKRR